MEKIEFKNLPDTNTPINAENLNQMQTNTENAINGVVESGSNDKGSWTKWADGTMICTRTIPVNNASVSSAWGTLYYYQDANTYEFAKAFINTPTGFDMFFQPTAANGCWLCNYGQQSVTKYAFKNFTLMRPTSNTVSGNLFVTAIGRWK